MPSSTNAFGLVSEARPEHAIGTNVKRRHLTKKQQARAVIDALKAEKSEDVGESPKSSRKIGGSRSGGSEKGIRGKAIEISQFRFQFRFLVPSKLGARRNGTEF
jgi:hypothetical protein